MMKVIIIIILLLQTINCFAQKNNSISLNTDNIWLTNRNTTKYNQFKQVGISYSRLLNKRMFLALSYNLWNRKSLPSFSKHYRINGGEYFEPCFTGWNNDCAHKIFSRKNYTFYDIQIGYNLLNNDKYGNISTNIGISLSNGKNEILDTIISPQTPTIDTYESITHIENKSYFGIIPSINYSYYFWKKRIVVGTHFKLRKYYQQDYYQFDFGLHVGYLF